MVYTVRQNIKEGISMKNSRQNKTIYTIILASIFAAIITVLTFSVKIPSHNGYIHVGDAAIYLAACLLPTPYALASAAIGGMLADSLGGYIVYIIPTMIIKALLPLAFSRKKDKLLCKRNLVALIPASLITIIGYYIAEACLLSISSGNFFSYIITATPWVTAFYAIPGNIIQALGSAVAFIFIAIALDKIKIKDRI